MNPLVAMAQLRETATSERAGDRAARRLSDVQAMLGDDLVSLAAELAGACAEGVSPATESAQHLLDAGGKRVRPLSVLLASACFGEVTPAAREYAVAAELVHLATLLHDDVVDDGMERRGRVTSRRIWGNAVSVLAGDLLLTHALERTHAAGNPETLSELFSTLRRLVDGEVVQLRGRSSFDATEATYFRIVEDKTAALFVWAVRAGARAGGASAESIRALGEFGGHLGVAFQLVDDVLDYAGSAALTGKALHADLREGKLTLPLLKTLAARPLLERDVLAARDSSGASETGGANEEAMQRLAAAVVGGGACDAVRELAGKQTRAALDALEKVPASRARELLGRVALDLMARLS